MPTKIMFRLLVVMIMRYKMGHYYMNFMSHEMNTPEAIQVLHH